MAIPARRGATGAVSGTCDQEPRPWPGFLVMGAPEWTMPTARWDMIQAFVEGVISPAFDPAWNHPRMFG